LIVSNHPGICDSASLLSIIERPDIKIAAFDKTFFKSLPNLYKYLIPIEEGRHGFSNSISLMLRHLENGGALLLYPAGIIEPDPEYNKDFLKEWFSVIGYFCLKAQKKNFNFKILPVVVSNIYSKKTLELKLVNLKKNKEEKEKSAALNIIITRSTKNQKIKIDFKKEFDSLILAETYKDSKIITDVVKKSMLN